MATNGDRRRVKRSAKSEDRRRAEAARRARAAERKPPPPPRDPAPSMHDDDPRLAAAIDLIRRTGSRSVGIRYSDDDTPVVWIAVAEHGVGEDGIPVRDGGKTAWTCDAALDPVRAVLQLAERLIDGGTCAWCARPAGLDVDTLDAMPGSDLICWWQFDPELSTFRRACEGDVTEKAIHVPGETTS